MSHEKLCHCFRVVRLLWRKGEREREKRREKRGKRGVRERGREGGRGEERRKKRGEREGSEGKREEERKGKREGERKGKRACFDVQILLLQCPYKKMSKLTQIRNLIFNFLFLTQNYDI